MNSASAPLLADAFKSRTTPVPPGNVRAHSAAWPVAILGVPFDHVTIARAVEQIGGMIASGRPHYVVTANVDFLVQAHRDVELRRILQDADLVLCDGTPLVWASRWLGNALPERVAGSDLAPALIQAAAEKGHRIFLLGGAEGVAAEAAARLRQQHPTLNLVGHYAPPFSTLLEMDHAEIVRRVRAAKPDILLVSFGCPKQEKWIAMHHRNLGVPVAIGVGATIDFLAGRITRAPEWMRRTGTEWLYRLAMEPRRLYRRYATDLVCFLPTLARQWIRLAPLRDTPAAPREITLSGPDWCAVDAGQRLTRGSLERHAAFWRDVQHRSSHCLVDVSKLRSADGTGVAFLLRWRKHLAAAGHQLVLLAPSRPFRRLLEGMKLNEHFLVVQDLAQAAQQAEALLAQPTVQRDGRTRTLAWCGEIIAANVDDVWHMTAEHIEAFVAHDTTLIIVDIARVRFIDSSGAALMLRLKKWSQALHVELLFANPHPNVRNVLRLTRIDQLLLEGGQ